MFGKKKKKAKEEIKDVEVVKDDLTVSSSDIAKALDRSDQQNNPPKAPSWFNKKEDEKVQVIPEEEINTKEIFPEYEETKEEPAANKFFEPEEEIEEEPKKKKRGLFGKKQEEFEEEIIEEPKRKKRGLFGKKEEEIIEVVPEVSKKRGLFGKKDQPALVEEEVLETPEPQVEESISFNWANTEEYEAKMEKLNKKKKRKRKGKKEDVIEEVVESSEEVVDLNKFFEDSKKKNKKLLIEEEPKKDKKEKKSRKSKKQSKRERSYQDVKDQKVFRFRNKRYTKIEDFVQFLHENYLDIDEISREVLDDENFFGWVSKKSGIFDVSLKEFKEIKAKIEDKS